jgi:hypothetical protein
MKSESEESPRRVVLRPEPDDFDPYGKDVSKLGSSREMVYRISGGRVELLSDLEAELARPPRKAKKAKTNRRGNRCL